MSDPYSQGPPTHRYAGRDKNGDIIWKPIEEDDKKIRVVRILEYTYPNAEAMVKDQANWHLGVSGIRKHGTTTIRSTTLPVDILEGDENE